jgi:hypothetical protein
MSDPFAPSANEVLPRLWLGDASSVQPAFKAGLAVLNVLEGGPVEGEHHIPILLPPAGVAPLRSESTAYRARLDEAAAWIEERFKAFPALLSRSPAANLLSDLHL